VNVAASALGPLICRPSTLQHAALAVGPGASEDADHRHAPITDKALVRMHQGFILFAVEADKPSQTEQTTQKTEEHYVMLVAVVDHRAKEAGCRARRKAHHGQEESAYLVGAHDHLR